MLREFETLIYAFIVSLAGGACFYIQRLFHEDGTRKRQGSYLEGLSLVLGTGLCGLCLSLVMFRWYGKDDIERMMIVGLNGLLALAGIGVNAILSYVLKRMGLSEGTGGEQHAPRGRTPRPDSDSRPV